MLLLLLAGLDWRILRLGSPCLVGPPIRLDFLGFSFSLLALSLVLLSNDFQRLLFRQAGMLSEQLFNFFSRPLGFA